MTPKIGLWARLTGRSDDDPAAPASTSASTSGQPQTLRFTRKSRTAPYFLDTMGVVPGEPAPLVIHLHGDGYQEITHLEAQAPNSVVGDYLEVVRAHGAIGLFPRTPDLDSGTWYEKAYSTSWLVALIGHVLETHDVDRRRIHLSGFSGGAEEITYNLLADHHELFDGGGAMMLGGGGAEGVSFTGRPSKRLRSDFRMRWHVGERDIAGATQPAGFSARDAAEQGRRFYAEAGFPAELSVLPGAAHGDSEVFGPVLLHRLLAETEALHGLREVPEPAGLPHPR